MENGKRDTVATVSLIVYELMAERSKRVVGAVVAGWAVSVVALAAALAWALMA